VWGVRERRERDRESVPRPCRRESPLRAVHQHMHNAANTRSTRDCGGRRRSGLALASWRSDGPSLGGGSRLRGARGAAPPPAAPAGRRAGGPGAPRHARGTGMGMHASREHTRDRRRTRFAARRREDPDGAARSRRVSRAREMLQCYPLVFLPWNSRPEFLSDIYANLNKAERLPSSEL
jgi:hypothetical protein